MNKKICMFVWNHFTNDARVHRECSALAEAGYEVDLIAIYDKKTKKNEIIDGFNVFRVDRHPKYLQKIKKELVLIVFVIMLIGLFLMREFLSIYVVILLILLIVATIVFERKIISFLVKINILLKMIRLGKNKQYKVYHSNDLNTLIQGIICAKIFTRKKRILIYDSHEVQTSRTGYGKHVYYIEKILIKFVDKIIMTTDTRADYLKNLYKIDKPEVIHNYATKVNIEEISGKIDLHKILNIDESIPIFLYQGGIQVGRGLENIIKAVPYFKQGVTVFIGDGKLKPKLISLVDEMNIQEKVFFIDKVPHKELLKYTSNAFLGFQVLNNVCFNHYSALSNKLFEYIMAEVPIVACSFPEIKKIVETENIGICIDSHNPNEIAMAVNKLVDDSKLYNGMKERCKNAKVKYNWEKEKEKYIEIYNKLCR